MSDVLIVLAYLVVSVATYVGLLRVSYREVGVDWFVVLWSLFAFIPVVGQVVLLIIWLITLDYSRGPQIPTWLRRLAGER